ncbi:MAG TPA: serine/threonine-protein kinase, partial [Thermoanaerobaculia bacterium]|nr:serine/threonine-protein kinase [Thermoanaerobaculia bacterium]
MNARTKRQERLAAALADRYEFLELIGEGGFASVYQVRNLRLRRVEALKVLAEDDLSENSEFAQRFEQEAHVSASLDHPNIVKIYDYGAIETFFWFSMQYIDGASVGKELKTRRRIEDTLAVRIVVPVLDALSYSHARGVIHRDIKPDNILLDRTERSYLTDFGVAKSELALVKTHAGTLLGSPAYMSPEQLQGKPLDGRSDLYSVGVTLFKMLSGALPFTGEDTFRATMKRLSESPEPLSFRRPDIHPTLDATVMRALERDPEQRFPDAASMRDELEGFLAEVTPPRFRMSSPVFRPDDSSPTRVTPLHGTTPTSSSRASAATPRGTVPP